MPVLHSTAVPAALTVCVIKEVLACGASLTTGTVQVHDIGNSVRSPRPLVVVAIATDGNTQQPLLIAWRGVRCADRQRSRDMQRCIDPPCVGDS